MKLVYGMCGLGLAQAFAYGSAMTLQQASGRRGLQSISMDLCDASSSNTVSTVANWCEQPSTVVTNNQQWPGCCINEETPSEDILCRQWTTQGAFCQDTAENCFSSMTSNVATLDLEISFSQASGTEQCCQSCICFGDPECVAFDGSQNLWIPCDARVVNNAGWCPMWEYRCEEISADNVGGCEWIGSPLTTTQGNNGWNIAIQGSPCVPKLPPNQVTMNMFQFDDFSATLHMGERGVIKQLKLTTSAGFDVVLDADACFSNPNMDSWVGTKPGVSGPEDYPAGWSVRAPDTDPSTWEVVYWTAYDASLQIQVDFSCVRTVQGSNIGGARLNVDGITTPTSMSGSGYCATGDIPEAGDNEASKQLHAQCVQDRPGSALQACKHTVAMGATDSELDECATQFCSSAALTSTQKASCLSSLGGDSHNANKWRTYFCQAIATTSGGAVSEDVCASYVNSNGWNKATQQYGRGIPTTPVGSETCSTNLADYAVAPNSNEGECREGVFMQVNKTGEFEDAYFFPATCGPLAFSVVYSQATRDLFENEMRLIQCDPQTKDVCRALGRCKGTSAVEFSVEYYTVSGSAIDANSNGGYICTPKNDGTGSFICKRYNEDGTTTTTDLCPCENCNQQRRVLEELAH